MQGVLVGASVAGLNWLVAGQLRVVGGDDRVGLVGGCIGWGEGSWPAVGWCGLAVGSGGGLLGCTGLLLVAAAGRGVWGYKKSAGDFCLRR